MKPRTANGIKPVVALDIDGTLAPWHEHFREFLQYYTGRLHPPASQRHRMNDGIVWDGSVPFYRWLGISKDTYRQAKIAFRQGGFKRWMPPFPNASELTRDVRKVGAEVWLCTTRPYLRLDNIDPDTRHWCRRNGIQYDGVIFGERKYYDLASIVGGKAVVCVLDDQPEMVQQAQRLGMRGLVRMQPYNCPRGDAVHEGVTDLYHAASVIDQMIINWKDGSK